MGGIIYIQMPNPNGIDANKEIRTIYNASETTIVLVTAENINDYTNEVRHLDIQNALSKSINKNSIVNELKKWL
jgi:DNA-binding NarL/FixJ family response regulator